MIYLCKRVSWISCLTLGLMLLVVGCGSNEGQNPASNGQVLADSDATDGLVVTFGTAPSPPAKGENQIIVTVKRSDGSPVTDGNVTAVFSMAAMPSMNMPAMRTETPLPHAAEGRYSGTAMLSMGGTWDVAISVRSGATQVASRRTSVIAKE